MSQDGDLRASDAERDAVAAEIREHVAAGRLSAAKLGEPLEAVYRARTDGDLRARRADLPLLPSGSSPQELGEIAARGAGWRPSRCGAGGLLGCLACVLVGVGAPSAFAARTWGTPVDLSVGAVGESAVVATNAAGSSVVAWSRSAQGSEPFTVQAAVRPAGGGFAAAADLSAPHQNAYSPAVAMNGAGDAVVVWERASGARTVVQAAVRPASGTFSAPVDVSVRVGQALNPRVAMNAAGDAVAIWEFHVGLGYVVQAALRPAGAGHFAAPVNVSGIGIVPKGVFVDGLPDVDVSIDGAGDVVAVWALADGADADGSNNSTAQVAVRPAGGSFSSPVNLTARDADDSPPSVAMNDSGDAVVAWSTFVPDGRLVVQAASWTPTSGFATPINVSALWQYIAGTVQVAVGRAGDAIIAWSRSNSFGAGERVDVAVRPAGATFMAPTDVSGPGPALFPTVAIDGSEDAVAVWQRGDGVGTSSTRVQAAVRPAGQTFGAPIDLSPASVDAEAPDVAMDSAGDATATWLHLIGVESVVQAAGYARQPAQLGGAVATITGLRLAPTHFRAAGAAVSYRLSRAASVTFHVERARPSPAVHGRCFVNVRVSVLRKHCTRYVRVPGGFVRRRQAGTDRFRLSARLLPRGLKRGDYRLVAVPTANGITGNPVPAGFRLTG